METNTGVLSVEDCAELYFQYFVPSDTLLVFVFDAEVLESTEWNTVIEKYLVLKRYKLSLNDFENMDWIITYP